MNIYEYNIAGLHFDNKMIFDCAIGAGEATYYWAKALHDAGGSSRLIGFDIDLTKEDLVRITSNLGEYHQYVAIRQEDITDLRAYQNGSVDYINCDDTLVFLAAKVGNIESAFREFHRLLNDDGYLIVNSEIPVSWDSEKYTQNQYRRWNLAKAIYGLKGCIWAAEPEKADVVKILQAIGFELVQEKEFERHNQDNPIPCIEEWGHLMRAEIQELHISEALRESLNTEIQEIESSVRIYGMACPGYYSLRCKKKVAV